MCTYYLQAPHSVVLVAADAAESRGKRWGAALLGFEVSEVPSWQISNTYAASCCRGCSEWRREKPFHSVKIISERGYVELAPWCVGQVMQNGKQSHRLGPFTYKMLQRFPHADFTWWGWFQSYSYSFVCPGESCTKVKLLLTSS